MVTEKLELAAIIELFGHTTIACKVTESSFGDDFLQCDVPETAAQPSFTRIIAKKAVYAINPVTEEVMLLKAESMNTKPIESWDIRKMQEKLLMLQPPKDKEELYYDKDPYDGGDEFLFEDED